jgi:hypothetical protein
MQTKHSGKYVRAESDAEEKVSQLPCAARQFFYRDCMRHGSWIEIAYARVAIELCRRGYLFPPSAVTTAVDSAASKLAPKDLIGAKRVAFDKDACRRLAEVLIDRNLVLAEPQRDLYARDWAQFTDDMHVDPTTYDPRDDDAPGERKARQWRYAGLRNRAMRDKLERGECLDLSGCQRNAAGDYILSPDVWQEGIDYCDAETEEWVWSIGRAFHTPHGEKPLILASTTTKFYGSSAFECLFLR